MGIDAVIPPVHLPSQRHAHAYAEPMAQGTAVHFDAWQGVMGMADIFAAKFGELGFDFFNIQETFICQHGVQRFHTMAICFST